MSILSVTICRSISFEKKIWLTYNCYRRFLFTADRTFGVSVVGVTCSIKKLESDRLDDMYFKWTLGKSGQVNVVTSTVVISFLSRILFLERPCFLEQAMQGRRFRTSVTLNTSKLACFPVRCALALETIPEMYFCKSRTLNYLTYI